jgi:hypothetical protein
MACIPRGAGKGCARPPHETAMNQRKAAFRLLVALSFAGLLAGCPAIYPEMSTRIRKAMTSQALDPPPPENMAWVKFESARVPDRTRGGKTWDEAFGKKPDPYAKLLINGKEVFKTPVQSNTLEPTWPNGPKGNLRIEPDDKLRVELWDSNPLNDKPIGVRDIGRVTGEHRMAGRIRTELDAGGEVVITLEPARAMIGMGLWYELRTDSAFITRMLPGSPAERVGLKPGDEILKIGGKEVKTLGQEGIRSAFNAAPSTGLALTVRHAEGTVLDVNLKEGAIYPPYDEFGPIE